MALQAVVTLSALVSLQSTLNAGTVNANLTNNYGTAFADTAAPAAGLADKAWWDRRTLAASATESLRFASSGNLTNPFGSILVLARIKCLLITADAANTNNVVVGGGTTTATLFGATTHTVAVRPGMSLAWIAGVADAVAVAVASGTTDILQIANGGAGTPVTYSVVVVGAST